MEMVARLYNHIITVTVISVTVLIFTKKKRSYFIDLSHITCPATDLRFSPVYFGASTRVTCRLSVK